MQCFTPKSFSRLVRHNILLNQCTLLFLSCARGSTTRTGKNRKLPKTKQKVILILGWKSGKCCTFFFFFLFCFSGQYFHPQYWHLKFFLFFYFLCVHPTKLLPVGLLPLSLGFLICLWVFFSNKSYI